MSSDISARTLEDADMVTLSYADVEGAATGNPLIKEKLDADAQVTKYANASVQFQRAQQRAAAEAEDLPKKIANTQDIISRIKDDVAHRIDTHGDNFNMIVEGKTYTKRTEADKALESLKLTNTPRTIGNIGGYDVHAWQTISGDTKVELVRNRAYPAGKLSTASIENTLNRGIKDSLEYRRSALELEQDKLKQAQEKLKEENPYTAKLKAARDKQRELEQKINTLMTDKIIAELIQAHRARNTSKPYEIRGFEVFLHCIGETCIQVMDKDGDFDGFLLRGGCRTESAPFVWRRYLSKHRLQGV